jgi:hypothetical protein
MRNLRIAEVPTVLSPDNRDRAPHLRTWRDGWRSLRLLLLYSPRWLFLYPGIALLVIGLAGMAWLIPEQRTIGSVGFDVSTLLYAALAVVIGLQAVYFFITARSFGISEGLLPDDPRFRRLTGWVTLEVGTLLGLALATAGFALSIYAVLTWDRAGFGRLNYDEVLRIVIPGSTLITIGFQTILFSLFLGMLGLKRR